MDAARVRLAERMRRVDVLLASRFDYLPQPRIAEPATSSGPAEGRRVPCDRCRRTGRVVDRERRRAIPCVLCGGTGWRLRRAGEAPWDEYTGEELSTTPRTSRVFTSREHDHEISKLEHAELERRGVVGHLRHGWERARRARDLSGSYRELERVLELLPFGVVAASPAGLEWLATAMRGTIHVPEWAEPELAAARRLVAAELVDDGWTHRDIGRALGVSGEKVGRMVKEARRERRTAA